MEFYVYVLQSELDGSLYKGQTNNLEDRLKRHNNGEVKSTKSKRPWQIVYFEIFVTRGAAVKREQYFKTAAGRRFIKLKLDI